MRIYKIRVLPTAAGVETEEVVQVEVFDRLALKRVYLEPQLLSGFASEVE